MARFIGNLTKIDPNFLIHEKDQDELGGFFIVLSLIFNDIKGVLLFEKMLTDNYDKPMDEIDDHAGNYGGVLIQPRRLMASIISEFFVFLKVNSDILLDSEFNMIFNKMPKPYQSYWQQMVAVANGEKNEASDLIKSMTQIRSNITFHYDHSRKNLLKGYRSRFFGDVKDAKSEFAYYSVGDTVETTRFYFADAAAEEAMYIMSGKDYGVGIKENEALTNYNVNFNETLEIINSVISSLISCFIKYRRNHPR